MRFEMSQRSYTELTTKDLVALSELALKEREAFFRRNPHLTRPYKGRLLAIALCQGAAQHFVDKIKGVKDFDIWYFYSQHPEIIYPYRARKTSEIQLPSFGNLHVDLMGRTIDVDIAHRFSQDVVEYIREYLKQGKSKTARLLAQQAVVGLYPKEFFGEIIWSRGENS